MSLGEQHRSFSDRKLETHLSLRGSLILLPSRVEGASGDAFVFFRLVDRLPFETSGEEGFSVIGRVTAVARAHQPAIARELFAEEKPSPAKR